MVLPFLIYIYPLRKSDTLEEFDDEKGRACTRGMYSNILKLNVLKEDGRTRRARCLFINS
jgi:hypothetical protein